MGQIYSFLWTRKNKKAFSFSGGLAPLTPHRGLCPLDPRWGLCPQTPARTRHGIRTQCSSNALDTKILLVYDTTCCRHIYFRQMSISARQTTANNCKTLSAYMSRALATTTASSFLFCVFSAKTSGRTVRQTWTSESSNASFRARKCLLGVWMMYP